MMRSPARTRAVIDHSPVCAFDSLHESHGDSITRWPRPAAAGILDPGAGIGDFSDADGLVEQRDLANTVGTTTARLAGALGPPVWNLIPSVPDYRRVPAADTRAR